MWLLVGLFIKVGVMVFMLGLWMRSGGEFCGLWREFVVSCLLLVNFVGWVWFFGFKWVRDLLLWLYFVGVGSGR